MPIGIEVMYTDTSRVRTTFDAAGLDRLEKENVLFIALSTEWGNRTARVAAIWSRQHRKERGGIWHGQDIYVAGINDTTAEWFLHGHDDDTYDFWARKLADPTTATQRVIRLAARYPRDFTTWVFIGGYVEPTPWEEALQVFDTEMF